MNRLTYPQKFLLISLLFLLPLVVGLTILISTLNTDIDFARKELAGTTYLRSLRTLLAHTIEEQLLAERYFSGETNFEALVLAQHEQLKADLAALSLVDDRLGAALGTSVQYETLLNQWQRLDAQLLLRSVADNSAAHGRFIATIRGLMNRVGDQSNLILDSSLSSYYLMDTVLLELPESLELLSQTAGMAGPIATRQALIDDEKNRLTVLYGLVEANTGSLDHALKVAFNEDRAQLLRPTLSRPALEFNQAATTLLSSIDSGILKPDQVSLASPDLRAQIERSLSTSFALWDQSVGELDRLLLARIARFSLQRTIVLALSGLVVLITTYLLVGFYLGVMRTVGAFQQVTASMISGDFSRQVSVGTRDELGQVASSFNAIATALVESSVQRQAIVEHAAHAILTFDRQGVIESLNPAAARVFGAADLRGQPITRFLGSDLAALQVVSSIRELAGQRHDGAAFVAEVAIGQAQGQDTPVWIAFVRDITVRKQAEAERNRLQDEMIRAQAVVLAELSMPLIPITNAVMVMPLVGAMDSERVSQLLTTLLHGIAVQRARIAIVDVTGVPVVDTHVAHGIIKAAQGVQLLGAELVLTGIRPDVAQTLVGLGVDLKAITTRSTLQSGIAYALDGRL
jgi:PAS domain S-box-containing protein